MIEQHTINLDGRQFHYAEVHGTGPALVLLHGVTGSHQTFSPILATLAQHAHVFAPDLRGHNLSSHAARAYRLVDYGLDMASFLRVVVRRPAIIAGHSLGGMITIWLAAHAAEWVRAIHLEDPPVYITELSRLQETVYYGMFDGLRTQLRQHHASGGTVDSLANAVGQWLVPDGRDMLTAIGSDAVRLRATELHQMDPAVLDVVIAGNLLDGSPLDDLLSRTRCPVHLLTADPRLGGAMHAQDVRRFLSDVPQSTHTALDGVGHSIHAERPMAFVNSLEQHLAHWAT